MGLISFLLKHAVGDSVDRQAILQDRASERARLVKKLEYIASETKTCRELYGIERHSLHSQAVAIRKRIEVLDDPYSDAGPQWSVSDVERLGE